MTDDHANATNHVERAFSAWQALTLAAAKRETITYGQLGEAIGIHHRAIRFVLGVMQDHCLAEKLPPLTILVVNQSTRQPGAGFIAWDADDIQAGLAAVYAYNWTAIHNPFAFASDGTTEQQIVRHIIEDPATAEDAYARVKVRGIAQQIFRSLMLELYEGRCAFCGFSYHEALEAAHIVPWHKASASERLSPRNGLLLCSTHHRMFDANRLKLTSSFQIVFEELEKRHRQTPTESDLAATTALHGKFARMPASTQHQPCPELIERRYQTAPTTTTDDNLD